MKQKEKQEKVQYVHKMSQLRNWIYCNGSWYSFVRNPSLSTTLWRKIQNLYEGHI